MAMALWAASGKTIRIWAKKQVCKYELLPYRELAHKWRQLFGRFQSISPSHHQVLATSFLVKLKVFFTYW
jgi:hypothetical protein